MSRGDFGAVENHQRYEKQLSFPFRYARFLEVTVSSNTTALK